MKAILIPLLLLLMGLGAGAGVGLLLSPGEEPLTEAPDPTPLDPCLPPAAAPASAASLLPEHVPSPAVQPGALTEYARLSNQFLVPVVEGATVRSMVVLTLGLEVAPGQQDAVTEHEPRLRDRMLQVLFDHANAGGFNGMFTSGTNMRTLRHSLRAAAQEVLGTVVTDVLIVDIVRQDS